MGKLKFREIKLLKAQKEMIQEKYLLSIIFYVTRQSKTKVDLISRYLLYEQKTHRNYKA